MEIMIFPAVSAFQATINANPVNQEDQKIMEGCTKGLADFKLIILLLIASQAQSCMYVCV